MLGLVSDVVPRRLGKAVAVIAGSDRCELETLEDLDERPVFPELVIEIGCPDSLEELVPPGDMPCEVRVVS